MATVRVAALHFEGRLLGAGAGALLLLLLPAFARVCVALEQLVLRRILVLRQDWLVPASMLLGSVVFREVHDLVRVYARVVSPHLLLVALRGIEARLVHHLVEAC